MAASFFIGRWQPFHDGHKALVEVPLKEGKDVVIAVRDTPISSENPLTYKKRKKIIDKKLKRWRGRYRIIKIPDVAEVCYGRKVGYKIREIRLPAEIEAVSGTKIRRKWQ